MIVERIAAGVRAGLSVAAAVACAAFAGCSDNSSAVADAESIAREHRSGPLEVEIRVSPAAPTVADRVRMEVTTRIDDGFRVTPPDIANALPDSFTLSNEHSEAPSSGADGQRIEWRTYLLEPFVPGETEIPSLRFEYASNDGSGASGDVTTESIALTIRSVLGTDDAAEIAPMKGVADAPVDQRQAAIIIGAVLGGVLLAAIVAVWLVRRRNRRPAPPSEPAHLTALRALDALLHRGLIEEERFEEFFARLSGILRAYIEARFGLRATTRTTEEFLRESRTLRALDAADAQTLGAFLSRCDLVKFAKGRATPHQAHEGADLVRAFIERSAAPEQNPLEAAA